MRGPVGKVIGMCLTPLMNADWEALHRSVELHVGHPVEEVLEHHRISIGRGWAPGRSAGLPPERMCGLGLRLMSNVCGR